MTPLERRASGSLALIFALRMLGLFLVLPVFALEARKYPGGDDPAMVGLAMGLYGLTQAPDADFDALAAQYNEDTGMPETGYAVTENFTSFDEAFVKPAMALESVGDVAEPSPGMYGYYITQYAADIAQGPASLDAVQDTLLDELLQTKKGQVYSDTVDQWVAASEIVKYPERMKD